MVKLKTITLSVRRFPDPRSNTPGAQVSVYRCKQITDSVDYSPGEELTKKQVEELCASPGWKVTQVRAGDDE
jgi:hypothetical protein